MGSHGDDLKKDFKNMFKHGKEAVHGMFNKNNYRPNGGVPPFRRCPSPWFFLFYPKICVGSIILLTLLLCGVSFYGLIIIVLLMIIFLII